MAAIRQLLVSNTTVAAGASRYASFGMGRSAMHTTESDAQFAVQVAGVVSKLWCYVSANTLSGVLTVRFRKNTANGNQVLTFNAGITGAAEDTSNTDTLAAGDVANYSLVAGAGGTSATIAMLVSTWAATVDTSTIYVTSQSGGRIFSADSTANYLGLTAALATGETEANRQTKFRAAGILKDLSMRVITNGRGTATTLRVRKNGANGNGLLTFNAAATGLQQDTSNTDTIAVDDLVCYVLTTSTGGGNFTVTLVGSIWASTAGVGYYRTGGTFTNAAGATTYQALGGSAIASATEASVSAKLDVPQVLSNLSCYVSANAASGATTVRTRVNTANGNQSISVGAAATGYFEDTSNTDTIGAGTDVACIQVVNGGGGTVTFEGLAVKGTYAQTYAKTASDDAGVSDAAAVVSILSDDVNIDGVQLTDAALAALLRTGVAADGIGIGDAAALSVVQLSSARHQRHSLRLGLTLRL